MLPAMLPRKSARKSYRGARGCGARGCGAELGPGLYSLTLPR